MPVKDTPWPFISDGDLPELVKKFMLATIVVSLYLGSVVLILACGLAVTDLMTKILGSGSLDVGTVAITFSQLF